MTESKNLYDPNTRVTGSQPALILSPELKETSPQTREEDAPVKKRSKSRISKLEDRVKTSSFNTENRYTFLIISISFLILVTICFFVYFIIKISSLNEEIFMMKEKIEYNKMWIKNNSLKIQTLDEK